jgi:hypothetical protein
VKLRQEVIYFEQQKTEFLGAAWARFMKTVESGPDMTMPALIASPTTFPISTGPITRSRAKKIQQEVHVLLYEFQLNSNDNFMLPKSCMLILLRYVEENHQYKGHEARIGKVLVIRQGHSAISSNQQVIRKAIRQSPES